MRETQASIYQWAVGTFGEAKSLFQIASRAADELDELRDAIADEETPERIVEEAADLYIVSCQIAERLGLSLADAIDRKMQINRAREWKTNGDGTGQHVEGVEA